jgi:probable F420-dependent oxidoreductase
LDPEKLGVFIFLDSLPADDTAQFAQRVESWGYTTLWIPEVFGRDPFASASFLLSQTRTLRVATGIANIYARDAMTTRAAQLTLAEQSGGRFILGLGVSHQPVVEGMRGHAYGKPIETMRSYLDAMERAPYAAPQPTEPPPTLLAALGPRMLALARDRARGAHPYMVPPEHTAQAREILGEGPWLCTEQKVLRVTEPSRARELARKTLAMYLTLPNYRRNLQSLGFAETELDGGGSDRLIDALVVWGDEKTIRERIQAHRDAGADHVCVQTIHPEGKPIPDLELLEALAPGRG